MSMSKQNYLMACLYKRFALSTLAVVLLKFGSARGNIADLKGGGFGAPCARRASETGLSRARLAVPHGNPKWIPNRFGDCSMSHRIACPEEVVKSNVIIGTTALLPSWSMLKTEKPACANARDRDPRPAKISTNNGTSEFCTCETSSKPLQSEWLQR